MRPILASILAVVLCLNLNACSSLPTAATTTRAVATSTPEPSATPGWTPTIINVPTPTASHEVFRMTAAQAEQVKVLMEFILAYNAGQYDLALALLDDKIVGSDCDYEAVRAVAFRGKSSAAEWLRQRISDQDRLEVARLANENPDPQTGSRVIAVEYVRRSSRTLERLGFPQGISPKLATKVVFTEGSTLITAFANGSVGGDPNYCRPQ